MIGWKIYFIFVLILSLPSYMSYGTMRAWDIIDFIVFIPSIAGLFGFCWSKRLLNQQFWKSFFIVCIVWNIYYQYFVPMPQVMDEFLNKGMSQSLLATITWIPFIPMVIALYLYGFKKEKLWKE